MALLPSSLVILGPSCPSCRPELYRDRVLELNASDERGISVIRAKVKVFSELAASGRRPDGKACPPFKVVILDEADSMTGAAQAALRRTMERQCRTTRFCLICNYVTRIIDPITSRCAKFRFRPLPAACAVARLREICTAEGLVVGGDAGLDEGALLRVVEVCEGDLRRAVTLLQGLARVGAGEGEAALRVVDEMAGIVPKEWMDQLWSALRSGSFERMQKSVEVSGAGRGGAGRGMAWRGTHSGACGACGAGRGGALTVERAGRGTHTAGRAYNWN